jgi:predicted DNA-binding transcriptional regulator AlpA
MSIPERGFLRCSQIIGDSRRGIPPLIRVSRSTLWNWVNQGRFPRPLRIGPNVSGWRASEVFEWLEQHGWERSS